MTRPTKRQKPDNSHFEHAKKIVKSWPKWKQEIGCNPVKGLQISLFPMKNEH